MKQVIVELLLIGFGDVQGRGKMKRRGRCQAYFFVHRKFCLGLLADAFVLHTFDLPLPLAFGLVVDDYEGDKRIRISRFVLASETRKHQDGELSTRSQEGPVHASFLGRWFPSRLRWSPSTRINPFVLACLVLESLFVYWRDFGKRLA
jgi:hypothetical protein